MFSCTICGREYSNIGGIVTHQKNVHGEYDPATLQKTQNNKSQEHLGRPMQFKINKRQKNEKVDDFLSKIKGGFQDKKLQFFLDKNIKFVFNSVMEGGDPIIHKTKSNLFITDFQSFEEDPWGQIQSQPKVNFDQFFDKSTVYENFSFKPVFEDFSSSFYNSESLETAETQKHNYELRMKEFLTKLLEYIRNDQVNLIVQMFKIIMENIEKHYIEIVDEIKQILKFKHKQFPVLQIMEESTYDQFINNIVYGTVCYIREEPNIFYDTYFGYK